MIRVIAVDLDGTLLRSDTTVSARTVAALRRATDAGTRTVIVTARPPRFAEALAAEAGISGIAVCCNGAAIYDLATGDLRIVRELPIDIAARCATVIAGVLPSAGFSLETGHRLLVGPGYGFRGSRSMGRVAVATVDELWRVAESSVKLHAWSPAPSTDAILALLAGLLPDVECTYSGGGTYDITARGATKAGALAELCAGWRVDADEVIAFGDMPNDLSVLRWAGTSVAVANAHPEVLAAADRRTGSNDEDGVAMVLEELFS